MRVRGTVQAIGLTRRSHHEVDVDPFSFDATIHRVSNTYGYARLEPNEPARGLLTCSFDPDDRKDLEELSQGSHVVLDGMFAGFREVQHSLVVYLEHCSVIR